MRESTWELLEREFELRPRGKGEQCATAEIAEAERTLGCEFHQDYAEFACRFGSARIGADPIYGVRRAPSLGPKGWSVIEKTTHYRAQRWPGVQDWYVISMDGRGNPIGVAPDGRVLMSDHDVGDMPVLATSFEHYVLKKLDEAEADRAERADDDDD